MACAICKIRRPRRFCPGVRGDICTICCGTEREETINCPLECEYLREAHQHERPAGFDMSQAPNQDIEITEEFITEHYRLIDYLSIDLLRVMVEIPGAVDFDAREALESLIRTYRSLHSGIYYEHLPQNTLAAAIFSGMQDSIARMREAQQERQGLNTIRDATILGVFVFLQRIEFDRNNGRKRGRAFADFLRQRYEMLAETVPKTSLIVP
jgi:hypothetical protein